jgi:hypothetical protein
LWTEVKYYFTWKDVLEIGEKDEGISDVLMWKMCDYLIQVDA